MTQRLKLLIRNQEKLKSDAAAQAEENVPLKWNDSSTSYGSSDELSHTADREFLRLFDQEVAKVERHYQCMYIAKKCDDGYAICQYVAQCMMFDIIF